MPLTTARCGCCGFGRGNDSADADRTTKSTRRAATAARCRKWACVGKDARGSSLSRYEPDPLEALAAAEGEARPSLRPIPRTLRHERNALGSVLQMLHRKRKAPAALGRGASYRDKTKVPNSIRASRSSHNGASDVADTDLRTAIPRDRQCCRRALPERPRPVHRPRARRATWSADRRWHHWPRHPGRASEFPPP